MKTYGFVVTLTSGTPHTDDPLEALFEASPESAALSLVAARPNSGY
jgi:hypothetical protein